jgi:hypothetical protein
MTFFSNPKKTKRKFCDIEKFGEFFNQKTNKNFFFNIKNLMNFSTKKTKRNFVFYQKFDKFFNQKTNEQS